jgi:hypothetical protein
MLRNMRSVYQDQNMFRRRWSIKHCASCRAHTTQKALHLSQIRQRNRNHKCSFWRDAWLRGRGVRSYRSINRMSGLMKLEHLAHFGISCSGNSRTGIFRAVPFWFVHHVACCIRPINRFGACDARFVCFGSCLIFVYAVRAIWTPVIILQLIWEGAWSEYSWLHEVHEIYLKHVMMSHQTFYNVGFLFIYMTWGDQNAYIKNMNWIWSKK